MVNPSVFRMKAPALTPNQVNSATKYNAPIMNASVIAGSGSTGTGLSSAFMQSWSDNGIMFIDAQSVNTNFGLSLGDDSAANAANLAGLFNINNDQAASRVLEIQRTTGNPNGNAELRLVTGNEAGVIAGSGTFVQFAGTKASSAVATFANAYASSPSAFIRVSQGNADGTILFNVMKMFQ